MIIKDAKKIDLSDMIITIIFCIDTENAFENEFGTEVIYHHGEYDKPITLADISEKYPLVRMVISESGLDGKVYRYGNHEVGVWEEVGTTIGYA